jgi:hypothetical protein
MNNAQLREATDACRATGLDISRSEPSHIHVPRPSRIGQAIVSHHEEDAVDPGELDVTFIEAA